MADLGIRAPAQPGFNVSDNFNAAQTQLGLTPEEQALYQRHLANLWGNGGVDHDGGRSSYYMTLFNRPDGRAYTVPGVNNGQMLSIPQSGQLASQEGWNTFPSYDSEAAARARYGQIHDYIDADTRAYDDVRHNPLQLYRGGLF